ncbi:MAG: FG-GAP repeat domain-containing protein [Planctomycetota bacterium]
MLTQHVLLVSAFVAVSSSLTLAQGGPPMYAPPVLFPSPGPVIPAPAPGTPPTIFVTGDVSGDGIADVVHLNVGPAPDLIMIQLGTGAGFILAPVIVLPAALPATSIALGDMDIDGMLDIGILSVPTGGMGRQIGVGGGAFVPGPFTPLPLAGGALLSMAITDVTADALPDVLFLRDGPGGIGGLDSILIMIGLPGFVLGLGPAVPIGVGTTSFKPADLDLNGVQDLVTLQVAPVNAFYIHAQVAPATFVPGPMPVVPLPAGPATTTFEACDLDSDADLDLVTLRPAALTMFSLLQGAPGFFGPAIPTLTPPALAANFLITDVNGDCVLDAAYLSAGPAALLEQLGTGAGPFLPGPFVFPMPAPGSWIASADYDSDGTNDVVVLNSAFAFGDATWAFPNIQPDPPSVVPYGTGTPGRLGDQGMLTNGPPVVGTPGFGFTSTNCPSNALGLLFITDLPSAPVDPFGIGAVFLLDFFASTTVYFFDIYSGPNGSAGEVTGIPLDPTIVGLPFFAQTLWIWDTASAWSSPPVGASTSAGVMLTILP